MFPRRTSPAAPVVDRGQRSKVARSSGDRPMRQDDVRPRALMRSSPRDREASGGIRDTGTWTHSQANVHTFS
jgi:hypothetical protein